MKYLKENLYKIYKAFIYSLSGIKSALSERAFKQESLCLILLCCYLYFAKILLIYKIILIILALFVLILELINSAIESIVNMITLEYNTLAKKAKDMASAAVFLSILIFIIAFVLTHYI